MDNIRQTITLCRDGQPCELPAQCRERLHTLLRWHWQKMHAIKQGE